MQSHFFLMVVFALCVSAVFGGLMREDAHEQVALAARMFGAMVAAAIIIGWLMYPFPI
jgi:hypothetical protein